MTKKVVVALGGNAILQSGQDGTFEEQMENVKSTARQITRMLEAGYEVVVTHGNGPQVGAILIQNEAGSNLVPPMPMDVCGAKSQGMIGYMLCQALRNSMLGKKLKGWEPCCVVTQVEVDPDDPAFTNPTKPVGPFYTAEEAEKRMIEKGEVWIEDSGRGWRRVVPSPDPKHIVEAEAIRHLFEEMFLVIACGGGGIPVIKKKDGTYQGVEAVIDKDLAGERLAQEVGANIFMILTDVPRVAINFKKPNEKWLDVVTPEELRAYEAEGHFKAGSMEPKVKAVIRFIENGGKRAIIAKLDSALEALKGETGTQIVPIKEKSSTL